MCFGFGFAPEVSDVDGVVARLRAESFVVSEVGGSALLDGDGVLGAAHGVGQLAGAEELSGEAAPAAVIACGARGAERP